MAEDQTDAARRKRKRWRLANPDRDRDIQRRSYHKNAAKHRDKKNTRTRRLYVERREFLNWLKEEQVCSDCHHAWPTFVLEFDHCPGVKKRFSISDWARTSVPLNDLQVEIAKCDLVCANCHRIRTYGLRRVVQ